MARAATRKERLEQVFQNVRRHAAAVVREDELGLLAAATNFDLDRAGRFDAVQAIGHDVQYDLLELLDIDLRDDGLTGREKDLLVLVLAKRLDHFEHALNKL